MLNDTNKSYTAQSTGTDALATQTLKLGTHRGNRRIWLDHSEYLSAAGFLPGATYTADYVQGVNTVSNGMIVLRLNPDGQTKVSKKTKGGKLHPVIDMNSKKIGAVFPDALYITAEYADGSIFITAPYENSNLEGAK